jgi:hypothetical protein
MLRTDHRRTETSRHSTRDFPSAMIPDEEYLAAGIYEDGAPGEIFITTAK